MVNAPTVSTNNSGSMRKASTPAPTAISTEPTASTVPPVTA